MWGGVIACWLVAGALFADDGQRVRIEVRVPPDTPAAASLYLAGSLPDVGSWRPDGVHLIRQADGRYAGDLQLTIGQTLEFKITRGSWATVEKDAAGGDRPNRSATIDAATRRIEVTVARWANGRPASRPKSTVVGTLEMHHIDSRALGQSRTIRVWLPPDYVADPGRRYAVLYMHDGQNCFDRATSAFGNEWEIDESLTRLGAEQRLPPLIVVGVDNGLAKRIDELTYTAEPRRGGGGAKAYTEFLLTEVKPFVERTYRTLPGPDYAFLGGSSLGGLVSLEIARRHPHMFGAVIAMSPALRWADEALTTEIERDPGGLRQTRVWLDMGTREGSLLSPTKSAEAPNSTPAADDPNERILTAVRRLDAALTRHHVAHRLFIDDAHPNHDEPAWASRFPQAIDYLFEGKSSAK